MRNIGNDLRLDRRVLWGQYLLLYGAVEMHMNRVTLIPYLLQVECYAKSLLPILLP